MTIKTHGDEKSVAKVLNQKVTQQPKSSDGLVPNCVTLSQWFLHKTATSYT